ncbi:rhodanese-like domain-containing protein [Mariniradius sediminis]|uniref:Rhodanese-like domain-containing protein n=1 Tax=Mariniradius sediminis TaxID=2909237 RepID=A0ABS9BSN8_9BACT|nr:rhodanese-like domain-containing protein [Mariniradius sediminis]MCF1750779.1 rhodanese-like domain-containing protein [Mariniradius sediminis]
MKTFVTFLVALSLLSACGKSPSESGSTQTTQATGSIEQVDAAQFKKLTESPNALVLDVRTAAEVAEGHLPNAVNIDIYGSDFMAKVQELPKDREILVYCTVGARSQQAADILSKQGFAKVYNLDGGIVAWQRNGFEVVR